MNDVTFQNDTDNWVVLEGWLDQTLITSINISPHTGLCLNTSIYRHGALQWRWRPRGATSIHMLRAPQ